MTEGRSAAFGEGYSSLQRSRNGSSWKPTQTRYQNLSVLDNYKASGNGFGSTERNRVLPDGRALASPNGHSEKTWEARQWIASPYKTIG